MPRKQLEQVVGDVQEARAGIIVRVPFAPGFRLRGCDESATFGAGAHRSVKRHSEAIDLREALSGVPHDVDTDATGEVAELTPEGCATAQLALTWIVAVGVAAIIPGHIRPSRTARADLLPLEGRLLVDFTAIYTNRFGGKSRLAGDITRWLERRRPVAGGRWPVAEHRSPTSAGSRRLNTEARRYRVARVQRGPGVMAQDLPH